MAYSQNFPAQRASFMADFANAGRLDNRISFTRASTANVWDGSKHLSSENLFKYSNDLDTGWVEDNLTFTSGQTAPDGGSDAFKITENSATNEHRFYPSAAIPTDGGTTTFSGHFKYIGRQWIVVKLNDGSTDRRVWFDIQNGAVGTTNTGITASITSSGGGYYKVVATIATSSTSYFPLVGGASADNVYVYAGSGADAFYVWGLQYNHNVGSVLNETSGQIHREYAPSLVSKANNVGRFDYSTDGQSAAKGILVEGQATNLYGNSLDMTGVSGARTIIDSSVAVGPTGELTADALRLNDTNANTHYREYSFTAAASTTYTFSVYLKAAGLSHAAIRSNNLFSTEYVHFNLTNGTVEGSPAMSNSMTAVGNGFYRCSVTATTTGSGAASFVIYITDSAASTIVATGDSYRAILGQAIQIEAGSHPSSFIETSGGTTATRASESLSMTDSSLFSGNEGTIAFEGQTLGGSTGFGRFWTISDGTNDNRIHVYPTSSTAVRFRVYRNNIEQRNVASGVTDVTQSNRYAFAYEDNKLRLAQNGSLLTDDSNSAVMPVVNKLSIGMNGSGSGNQMNGYVKRIAFYGQSLSDTEMTSLSS